ncbi:MAG: deoxyribonuclease IV [Chloroflexota bacterium]
MSIGGAPANALRRGRSIGCDTIQMFTRSPNQWAGRELTADEIAAFYAERAVGDIAPVVAHSSYLINLASPDEALWQRSLVALITELGRCAQLGLGDYVLHPGSHMGAGVEAGLERAAQALRAAQDARATLAATTDAPVRILLETTAGQGDSLGCTFEQLAWLRAQAAEHGPAGVCFDTAHALAAGYEFRDAASYAALWDAFDATIGLEHLGCIHLNDSKRGLGARVDRHEQIGRGEVGLEAFRLLVNDGRLAHVPMILETPKGPDLKEDIENLALLRSLIGQPASEAAARDQPTQEETPCAPFP